MQVPAHSFCPSGQVAPHAPLLQVALPPSGAGQGSQAEPQLSGLSLLTHSSLHRCASSLQPSAQVPSIQVAVAWPLVGHTMHVGPHPSGELSGRHAPSHR
jgi:hypothetical protein